MAKKLNNRLINRYGNRPRYTEEFANLIFSDNSNFLAPFGKNFKALREYTGKSTATVKDDLMNLYLFYVRECTIKEIERNDPRLRGLSIIFLSGLSLYWGIPLLNMVTVDYSIESNIPDHIKAMRVINPYMEGIRKAKLLKQKRENNMHNIFAGK